MNDKVSVILIYSIFVIIVIGIGVGVFFICRSLSKKLVKRVSTRQIVTWLATFLLTPIVCAGLTWLVIFIWTYYPNKDFNKDGWQINRDKHYEYSTNIIKSRILIGKSKKQVKELLGPEENTNESDNWEYDLGNKPDILTLEEFYLFIQFKNGKVVSVEQHYKDD